MHVETILPGQLVGLPASGGVPYGQVQWQASPDLVHWSVLTTLTLDGSGQSTYTFSPSRTAYYRVRFDDTGTYGREVFKVVVVQPSRPRRDRPAAPATERLDRGHGPRTRWHSGSRAAGGRLPVPGTRSRPGHHGRGRDLHHQ